MSPVELPLEACLWPQYRHDDSLSGRFPGRGHLVAAPRVRWSVDLGAEVVPAEVWRVEDVDGDGQDEWLRLLPDQLVCQDLLGGHRWTCTGLPRVQVVTLADLTGDGGRGLLLDINTGTETQTWVVDGRSGERVLLYAKRNVFGESRRLGHLLAGVPGQQLCAWWSGDGVFGERTTCDGWVFSFEQGVTRPTVRFRAHEEGVIYAPLHLIADMDGDGRAEMVMISHEQLWVYDLDTSQRLWHSRWTPATIRTYWAHTAALPLRPGARPSLLMINPHLPGLKVVDQDGTTAVERWRVVVGVEDQYQSQVKIEAGAPDPFADLDGDGQIEIMAAITNEHGDGRTWLAVFGADRGQRRFEAPQLRVLGFEDLDGDGRLEVFLLQADGVLRLANWDGAQFVDRWRGRRAEPLFQPAPLEQDLGRSMGARNTLRNPVVWRETPGAAAFLMRVDGRLCSWELCPGGSLQQVRELTHHPAVAPPAEPVARPTHTWDGRTLSVRTRDGQVITREVPARRLYLAPPPLVGRLGGRVRIVVRDYEGQLRSLAANGDDPRVLVRQSPAFTSVLHSTDHPQLCDVDGDGETELLASTREAGGSAAVVAVDASGQRKLYLPMANQAAQVCLGPTGRLPGGGRWVVLRQFPPLDDPYVAAYDGRTGAELWRREHFGSYGDRGVKFALHTPTAVLDYHGDGSDSFLAQSENFYNIVEGATGRELLLPMPSHSDAVPGHWTAYATPILVDLLGEGRPLVLHSRSFQLTAVSDLEGRPRWHWGLTRDTTARSHAGLGDLDGDGRIEPVVSQADGLLTAFQPGPTDHPCPSCPPGAESCAGQVRWTLRLPPPLSDITAVDVDGDGRDELLLGTGAGLCCLEEERGQPSVAWTIDLQATVGAPVVADLEGQGRPSILVTTEDGFLHCLA